MEKNNDLISVIEDLLEADMTDPKKVKNPQNKMSEEEQVDEGKEKEETGKEGPLEGTEALDGKDDPNVDEGEGHRQHEESIVRKLFFRLDVRNG